MVERYRPIIIDGKGTEKQVVPFPDKKIASINFQSVLDYLKEGRRLFQEFEVGQREATWNVQSQFPDLPIILHLCSDEHYGSVRVDYELWEKHLKIVTETPNTYRATNGDHVDFFNPTVHPTGMAENPLPPQMQARAYLKMLSELDRLGKLAVVGQGNHDQFGAIAGQDFFDTFLHDLSAPIFTEGGILNIQTDQVKYRIVMNHTFWGKSKINLTNAAKRLIEYEGAGDVDVGWVGHTHDSAYEVFSKGGRDLVAVISGTYKLDDKFGKKWGMGREGMPGICLMLWQDERKIEVFKNLETAQQMLLGLVHQKMLVGR